MTNEFRTLQSHSAEYFGDTRDYWWNSDFLALLEKRLSLHRVHNALDVGCGVGHWTHLLAKILPDDALFWGVDRDPVWVEKAAARTAAHGFADRFSFQAALAEKLPFPDASFDLVTCQTLLIHVPDPGAVIDEMIRVTRPGGLVLASEPNNISRSLVLDSLTSNDPVDAVLARVRLQLLCERGKAAVGEGNNSIGDLVPGLFAARGLVDMRVYLNDKANMLVPPYDTVEQRAMLEEQADFSTRDFWIWSHHDTRRYYLAGGGRDDEFDALWSVALGSGDDFQKALTERTYSSTGAAIGYLVAGRKPNAA